MEVPKRTFVTDFPVITNDKIGTWFSCSLHFFCAMVGSGVLAYPSAFAWLGWIAGPILIIVFYAISLLMAYLLGSVYRVDGLEFSRYHHAVHHILGNRYALACSIFQFVTIFVVTVAWAITGATSAQAIANEFCDPNEDCFNQIWVMGLLFGAAEILLSQIPNLQEAWWISAVGVICAVIYSGIAFIISIIHWANHGGQGSVGGIATDSKDKAIGVLNALGIIALGFSGGQVLLEIEDTLHQPPEAVKQMKKASFYAVTGAFFFYLGVAIVGYAAYGNTVDGFIVNSLGGPKWAIVLANATILIHVLSAFQVFAQAVFDTLESHAKYYLLRRKEKKVLGANHLATISEKQSSMLGYKHDRLAPLEERLSTQISSTISIRKSSLIAEAGTGPGISKHIESIPESYEGILSVRSSRPSLRGKSAYIMNTGLANEEVPQNAEHVLAPFWVRFIIRTSYVLLVTLVTCIMPFFSSIAGLAGSIIFWPLIVYLPIILHREVYGRENKAFDILLSFIFWGFLAVCIAAIVGSFYTVVEKWQDFQLFQ